MPSKQFFGCPDYIPPRTCTPILLLSLLNKSSKNKIYPLHSAYYKNLPPQLLSYFNTNNIEGHCLSSSNRSFIVPKCVSSSAQRSPIYKSILQWNIIPSSVKLSTSFRTLYFDIIIYQYFNI